MFPELQKKFVLLYTVTTGFILTLVLSAVFAFYISAQKNQQQTDFQNQLFSLTGRLQSENQFSDSFLAQTEEKYQLLIYLEENETPFFFSGSYQPSTNRKALFARAGKEASKEGIYPSSHPVSSSILQSSVFQVAGEQGDHYLGSVSVFQTKTGYKKLILLQDISRNRQKFLRTACFYGLAGLGGVLLFFFTGRWFVARSLKPLEDTYKKQQDFVASASHELRSPLSVIQTSAEAAKCLLADRRPAKNPSASGQGVGSYGELGFLDTIMSECRRGSSLIKNLLLLVTAEQNHWAVKKQNFEIDSLLLNLLELYEPLCFSKNGALLLELPEEPLPCAWADPDLCSHILTILLDNAITYALPQAGEGWQREKKRAPKPGRIILRAQRSRGGISVSVIDSGPGIPDEEKPLIFDRFYQSDKSRNRKDHFGLGLSIAAELAKIQGAGLKISDTPGGGTTFSLWIKCHG